MNLNQRIYFSIILFFALFFLVIAKAFYVQVINRERLVRYASNQIKRTAYIRPKRGNILDRFGNPLAINIERYAIYTIPESENIQLERYKKLVEIIPDLNIRELKQKTQGRTKYTWLTREIQLSELQLKRIKEIDGIYVEDRPARYYPNHELFSQFLGFVGVDNEGLSGIEFKFNQELRGVEEELKYLRDAKGRPVKFEGHVLDRKSEDIYLSIDKDIQSMAEKILHKTVIANKADGGGIGVIDVSSGEVLAMANYPGHDLNKPSEGPPSARRASFISDPFEPGSILKTLTIASGLQNRIIRPDSYFFCEYGQLQLEGHIITEAEAHEKFEWLSVTDILKYSSNIGISKIGFDVTYPVLRKTFVDFGLGEKTGIEIPGESRGIFPKSGNVSPLSLSNISFGQGIAVTAIQMLGAYATLANEGISVTPTILKSKKNAKNKLLSQTSAAKIIVQKDVAKSIEKMLVEVVEEGTGTKAIIPYFVIAGKTGTAQRPFQNGGYKGYVSSFIGYPVNIKDKFVVLVYIDNPQGHFYYSSDVATPAFKELTQFILYKNKSFDPLAIKGRKMENQLEDLPGRKKISRDMGPLKIPNFIGLDKRSAFVLAKKMNIPLEIIGHGIVKNQNPLSGEAYNENTIVKISLSSGELKY